MNSKIRFSLLVVGLVGLSNFVFAQTVEQGKKFYYYGRYNSAKDALEKTLASNPNNIEAVYWLGQTLLQMKDSVGAENLYSKALQSNGNAPLLLAGMGEIEIRKGKTADARQRFETAITLTKSKDVAVLNAVGKANSNPKDGGDATYAIEKLNLATQTKNFNNPETYVLLGDAYRKLIDGGNAVLNYQKALTIDPKYAEAKFKIGMIYLTQNNKDYFIPAFEDAVSMDPNYAPALYQLYFYYYNRDINKAKDYFDKYLAVSDPSNDNEYDRAAIRFASKDYDGAIQEAKTNMAKLGDAATPKYYKLIAYCYDAKGDSLNAKNYMDQYFAKQKADDFVPKDYSFRAQTLSKFPGNDSLVNLNYQLAVDKDTLLADKLDLIKEAADLSKKKGNKAAYADWLGRAYVLDKNPSNTSLYNWGYANYSAGNYKRADSIFCGIYTSKYPNEIYGYLWCAKSTQAEDDSLNTGGLAVEPYKKLAEVARALDSTSKAANGPDSIKYRSQIVNAYFFLAGYYNDNKKDKQTALLYMEKVMEVDPNNTSAPKIIEMLKRPARQPAAKQKGGTAAAPAKTGGGAGGK
jgi:tetratricopeptide (TPR) repeat protein